MKKVLFVVLLLALAFLGTSSSPSTSFRIEKLFFLHRHGARSGMGVNADGSINCAGEFCVLTDNGKHMCYALGQWLGKEYKDILHITGQGGVYNISNFMSSRSTDYPRVATSASEVVRGILSEAGPRALPLEEHPIESMPNAQDIELTPWNSWPAFKVRRPETRSTAKTIETVGKELLERAAKYFGFSVKWCVDRAALCVFALQDGIACDIAEGKEVPEWLTSVRPVLRTAVASLLAELFGVADSDPHHNNLGSFGYPLATSIVNYFNSKYEDEGQKKKDVWHIGAHDWTLFHLYTAIGVWTPKDELNGEVVPRFTETLLLELRVDGEGKKWVAARRGYPEEAPPEHKFTFADAPLACAKGGSSPNICSLEDFAKYVESMGPNSPLGICYATEEGLQAATCDCPAAPPEGTNCHFYRERCPHAPCGGVESSLRADPARGFACVEVDTTQTKKEVMSEL